MIRSSDGASSWTEPRFIDDAGFEVGPFVAAPMATPTVSSDGTLHIIYLSYKLSQNPLPGFYHATSKDGGASFYYSPVVFQTAESGESRAKLGYHAFADPSDPRHLAFVYVASTNGDLDVFFTESGDAGMNWSVPLRMNDDPIGNGVLQDLCWGSFNAEGDAIISWRDRRNADGVGFEEESEIWATWRAADSTRFIDNFRISDAKAAYSPILGETSGNDFMSIQMVKDTLYATWGDTRNGILNIWFEKKSIGSENTTAFINLDRENVEIEVWPNPASDQILIKCKDLKWVRIFDSTGRLVDKSAKRIINTKSITPGSYFLTLHDGKSTYSKTIMIQH